jgi:predicted glycosyltransferase
VQETAALAEREQPDAVVLIDSWGFTIRVAKAIRAARPSVPLIKYVGPQVWASRPGRARTLAGAVDHLLALYAFDAPWFEKEGLATTVVGSSALHVDMDHADGAAFRARRGIAQDARLLLVLPGSRPSEIRRMTPVYEAAIRKLKADGHRLTLIATKKDVLEDLLRKEGLEYRNFLPHGRKDNKWSIALGLLKQDLRLVAQCLRDRPDLMIGTSTEICHVGWLLRIPNIFVNEDDAAIVPLVDKLAHPFAKHLLAPEVCVTGRPGKTITYAGNHELAYLHPDLFTPDPAVKQRYIPENTPYFLLRFAKLGAHHDTNAKGISDAIARKLIELLEPHGRVYITSERALAPEFEPYRLNIHPIDIHHIMAFSSLFIGDSQTMSAESGVLGVPFIRFNAFAGKIGYLVELEEKYRLGVSIHPDNEEALYQQVTIWLPLLHDRQHWEAKRQHFLHDKIEVASFMTRLIESGEW